MASVESHLTRSNSEENENQPLLDDDDCCAVTSVVEPTRSVNEGPKDVFNVVYFVFFIQGMASLLPWNFFISVSAFWNYKFRDVNASHALMANSEEEETELQRQFYSYLSIASNVPNALFIILNAVWIGQVVNVKIRIYTSLVLMILLFFSLTILTAVNSDSWQSGYMMLVLLLVVMINICGAIFQGGTFGVAGKFPAPYIGALMAGQAMGGIFPSLVDILVTALPVDIRDVGFACFFIATMCLFISVITFSWASGSQFFHFHYYTAHGRPHVAPNASLLHRCHLVLKRSWQYCLAVFLVLGVTLTVFPAITVLIVSVHGEEHSVWTKKYFTPVLCFLLFNCGDYVGRISSSHFRWFEQVLSRGKSVLILAIVRIVFIPIFMLCNASPTERHFLPVLFNQDWQYAIFMTIFALSNGYVGNLCMLYGPKTSASGELQEETAMVLVASLVLGTCVGSALSVIAVRLL